MKLPYPCPRCGVDINNYVGRCPECIYGLRIKVFDHRLFKDDVTTPLSITMQPATVVDERTDEFRRRLYDVRFDYRPDPISRGHFTDCLTGNADAQLPRPAPASDGRGMMRKPTLAQFVLGWAALWVNLAAFGAVATGKLIVFAAVLLLCATANCVGALIAALTGWAPWREDK